jgi:Phospholipase_D-nuclease N-terminal/Short C-terminal domain
MVLAEIDFWELFWLLFIWLPLAFVWAFALVDIFRRDDVSGLMKAMWVAVVVILPLFGTLIYLLFRPTGATVEERQAIDEASRDFVQKYSPDNRAEQLKVVADLHDRGKLTDEEFAAEKARILAS